MTDFRYPRTPAEWQEAVDVADGLLAIESARAYGLITGGPDINVARCEDILTRGAAAGYRPRAQEVGDSDRHVGALPS